MLQIALLSCLALTTILSAQTPDDRYEKLITKDTKTTSGIFIVHQISDRFYYEIPTTELNREFLWNTRITKTTAGVGFGGFLTSDMVIRWQLNGAHVLLRTINYDTVADPASPIAQAVSASNTETILMSFDVVAQGANAAPVIEVTRLFNTDISEFNIRQRLGASYLDGARSWIDRVTPFSGNVESEVTMTWVRNETPAPLAGQMRPGDATVVVHHSMIKLPEDPMKPRSYDERVGYFTATRYDYSRDEARAPKIRNIFRWRMEKTDPAATISDPVKPIVYYVDSATPLKWRDWIRKGVEDWQPAFEAAGFSHAIIAKQAPDPKEDPTFSPEDVRNSVIRWLPSTTENAFGPQIHDPRTGEILNADIEFYQNMMNLVRNWYITQVGPLDPRAQTLPLPDDLMGRLVEYVIAHEVGHTLGLEHNLKASSLYPAEKVHDKTWVHEMGFTPSILDYVRFDYVAQPEDHIPLEDLIAHIGPYDKWALHWGYAPIEGDEHVTLDEWAREQDETPWLRYSTVTSYGADFGDQSEAVGDADAVYSTTLGLKNLQRVAKMLIPATSARSGEPVDSLAEFYTSMLGQWTTEMNHVVSVVGGENAQTRYTGQPGRTYTTVPPARMKGAVAFLTANAFQTPTWALDPDVLRRIEPVGALYRVRTAQTGILNNLLSSTRFTRLVEQQALEPDKAWDPADFLTTVRKGVWSELASSSVKIDAYRRALQRAWLDLAIQRITLNNGNGDERPLYRAQLKALRATLIAALPKALDAETRAHIESAKDQIETTLDPSAPHSAVSDRPVGNVSAQAESKQ